MLPLFSLLAGCASMTPQPASAVPADAALIVNGGSTNTRPYRIVVTPNGRALISVEGDPLRRSTLDAKTTASFFAHLAAAMPIDKIAHEPCMKSASFGSSTYVQYKGLRSPDVTCGIQGAGAKIAADVATIVSDLKVVAVGRRGARLLPQPAAPPPAPTQAPSAVPAPTAAPPESQST